jgi:hypothetical protein
MWAGLGSKVAAPFAAAGNVAMTSLKNIRDTLDFLQLYHKPHETEDDIAPNVEKVLYGLDAIQGSGYIDPDARIATTDPAASPLKAFGRWISGKE